MISESVVYSSQPTQEPSRVEGYMTLEKDHLVSAQVTLPAATGRVVDAETLISSDNISEYAPSLDTVAQVTDAFAKLGFDVGEMVGISLSITAPAGTFEEIFAVRLCQQKDGGIMALHEDCTTTYELPLKALPEHVAGLVMSVTFTPPPDFGPTEFFGS